MTDVKYNATTGQIAIKTDGGFKIYEKGQYKMNTETGQYAIPAEGGWKIIDGAPKSVQIPANMAAPGAQNVGPEFHKKSALESFGIGGSQGLSFGLGEEIASGIAATVGRPNGESIQGDTWGQRYDNALQIAREGQRAAEEQNPGSFITGQILGGIAPAMVAPELFVGAPGATTAARIGQGALAGGASGAAYGFGTGEGGVGNRLENAAIGGALGGALGAAFPAAGPLLKKIKPPAAPTNKMLKESATAAYKTAEGTGTTFNPASISALAKSVRDDLEGMAFHPKMQPQVAVALDELEKAGNKAINLQELEVLRRFAGNAAQSQQLQERMFASKMIEKIDDFLDNAKPQDISAGDVLTATSSLNNARKLWGTMRKSEMIDDAVLKATDQAASTNSGGNLQNIIRQKLRAILDNPKKLRGFTKDEQAALREIVRGSVTQNTLRTLGRLAPSSNAWLGVLSTWAVPNGIAVPVAGAMAKSAADRSTKKAVQELSELVRSGGVAPKPVTLGQKLQAPYSGELDPYAVQVLQRLLGQQAGSSQ